MAVVHGSSVNISPLRRLLLCINVSAVDNRGESFARPEYYAAGDFNPLVELEPDCLLNVARNKGLTSRNAHMSCYRLHCGITVYNKVVPFELA